ncbi:hypothetical protein [Actinophytocola sediminis]
MTGDALDRLRAGASRGDYASMARLASALQADGQGPREVLRQCYGVDFPVEFFVVAEAKPLKPPLMGFFTTLPWKLVLPLEQGGPPPEAESFQAFERKIFDRDPDLVPLMWLFGPHGRCGDRILCYRLRRLHAGHPTVYGIPEDVGPRDRVRRCGGSLLTVLRAHHAEELRQTERERRRPSNWGAGSVDLKDVAESRTMLEQIATFQRETTRRGG